MDDTFNESRLADNKEKSQFELWTDRLVAKITYRLHGNKISLLHTEVEEAFQGKGAGTAIIEKTLHSIEEHGQQLVPYCPFVVAFIKRHPEWKRILDPGVRL
jgi:predicted GNAT family acetyltransferase